MAQTSLRINESTHALLRQLADAEGVSLVEELDRAVQARHRELFFDELKAGYAAMTSSERAEDAAEVQAWDMALADGLERE